MWKNVRVGCLMFIVVIISFSCFVVEYVIIFFILCWVMVVEVVNSVVVFFKIKISDWV